VAQVIITRQQQGLGQQLPLGPLFYVFEEVRQLRRAMHACMHAQRTACGTWHVAGSALCRTQCLRGGLVMAMPSPVWTALAQELTRRLVIFFGLVGLLWGLLVGLLGLPAVRST
jgi:hypothetical protein